METDLLKYLALTNLQQSTFNEQEKQEMLDFILTSNSNELNIIVDGWNIVPLDDILFEYELLSEIDPAAGAAAFITAVKQLPAIGREILKGLPAAYQSVVAGGPQAAIAALKASPLIQAAAATGVAGVVVGVSVTALLAAITIYSTRKYLLSMKGYKFNCRKRHKGIDYDICLKNGQAESHKEQIKILMQKKNLCAGTKKPAKCKLHIEKRIVKLRDQAAKAKMKALDLQRKQRMR